MKRVSLFFLSLTTVVLMAARLTDAPDQFGSGDEWPEYLGGPDRNHYSTLSQINTANVAQLRVAWEYHTGDAGQMQCNPIMVDGTLYGVTAGNQLFALDAATGREKWRYVEPDTKTYNTNRGVTYWKSSNPADTAPARLLYAYGPSLYAINAQTGQPIMSFGENGRVSLKAGLGESAKDKFVISNTPGTLYEDLLFMPLRVSEGADAAPGSIQAFNVRRTGKLAWVFHTIPHPGEFGYDTWPKDTYKNTDVGAANNWAGMAIDRQRGILYVPTGSAGPDFYGGNRKGQNLFANSLVALNARTGKRIWHYQIVHHDLWDRDLPAPPNLITLHQNGKSIDAVAQVTKSAHVFIFDRVTGKPLFPIREVPVSKSPLPDEAAWPTQPIPDLPAPFARQTIAEADLSPYAANRDSLISRYRRAKKGPYQPLGTLPTLVLPGSDGGPEWGGAAVDPEGIMYVNANEMGWLFSLSPTATTNRASGNELAQLSPGRALYTTYCVACHGPDRKGNPASGYPSLEAIGQRRDRAYVSTLITGGKGMMPGFSGITADQKQALLAFLFDDEKTEASPTTAVASNRPGTSAKPASSMPYRFNGYTKFLDDKGYPAIKPPWGTLTAINLNTGKQVWQQPLGEIADLTRQGIPPTGTENYGGPVVTAGGLLFIAATKDGMFRAYDKTNGKLLWQVALPAAGFATPSTYSVGGKQYVVVACGGNKLGARKGDSYVAFALPDGN